MPWSVHGFSDLIYMLETTLTTLVHWGLDLCLNMVGCHLTLLEGSVVSSPVITNIIIAPRLDIDGCYPNYWLPWLKKKTIKQKGVPFALKDHKDPAISNIPWWQDWSCQCCASLQTLEFSLKCRKHIDFVSINLNGWITSRKRGGFLSYLYSQNWQKEMPRW